MLTQQAECLVAPQPSVASNNLTFESEHPTSLSVILGYCSNLNVTYRSRKQEWWVAKRFDLGRLYYGGLESVPFATQLSFSRKLWAFEYSDMRGLL